jgi:UDP-N-acetylmuramate--alanine ligase
MKVHFLGLGGAGLSALAGWMIDQGYQVSGCDIALNERIKPLLDKGVEFKQGNSPDHITSDLDWLIHPNIDQSHKEIQAAKQAGVETSTYFQALGKVTADYKTIAVSGAHGKTTTTLMIKTMLEKLDQDPNAIVGEGIYRHGESDLFVVEACEYKRQFLSLTPNILIITNIAYDHPDCYDSIEEVEQAFEQLISQMESRSWVIGYDKDPLVKNVLSKAKKQGLETETFGVEIMDYQPQGWGSDSVLNIDGNKIKLHLDLPGRHNVLNALAAIKAVAKLGLNPQQAADRLTGFTGCRRRLEKIGQIGQAVLIDDYGHHPDQIQAVLNSLRNVYPNEHLVAVFEPHQYERTWQLFDRFTQVWEQVDKLYLLPIYKIKGRESKQALESVNIDKLYQALKENDVRVELVKEKEKMLDKLRQEGKDTQAIILFSAGPFSDYLRQQKL